MPENQQLISYLQQRASTPVAQIRAPGPSRRELEAILSLALRVPDHGKLAPWRLIVYRGAERQRLGEDLLALALEKDPDLGPVAREAEKARLTRAPVVVAVASRAAAGIKVPEWEQELSAGALCHNLLIAANAHGYVANWRTEWISYDARALAILGFADGEKAAGFIHIGSSDYDVPPRPRPALADVVSWIGGD